MRILYAASEIYPLVKTGGLADVTAALPPALRARGLDVRLLLPGLPGILSGLRETAPVAEFGAGAGLAGVTLRRGTVPDSGVPAYVIDAPDLYDRPGNPYLGPDGRDWADNHRRFALLGRIAARFAEGGIDGWQPAIIHGHDWHAGLAPAYLAAAGRPAASVFTIHNLAFQGLFPPEVLPELGLPDAFFAMEGIEFYGKVSFMKAGLQFADRITTVSPTYAREIQTPEHGAGLDGLLRARAAVVSGILNGVDYGVWNPAADPHLARPYDADDPAPKQAVKAALQAEAGIEPAPEAVLFGAVTRLTHQKGFDLVLAAAPEIVALGGQLVLLGAGDPELEDGFRALARRFPRAVSVRFGYDEAFAHRIMGGADIVLVPSRFEPCGLTQLYALRYGALPLVRRTGGLADTVVDADERSLRDGTATGFAFDRPDPDSLLAAARRAAATYRERPVWTAMQRRAMTRRFGWEAAAERYAALYAELAEP